MRSNDRRPGWQHDVRWLAALLLVGVVMVMAAASSLARLTAPSTAPTLARAVLTLVVGPSDEAVRAAPTITGYQPGSPLALLPGLPVVIDADEIAAMAAATAVERIAAGLTDRLLEGGADAAWQSVEDPIWREVLEQVGHAVVRPLVVTLLSDALGEVGVFDGTRAANWPQQAQQNPGAEVQPLVGVFVTFPPLALQGRSPREIGALIAAELARLMLAEGAAAARERLGNAEVAAAFERALAGSLRDALTAALSAVVATRAADIDVRLADARAVIAGSTPTSDPWAGLVDPSDLGRLDDAARRERVLDQLAERAALGGSAAVLAALPESGVRARVVRASAVLDSVGRDAHRQARAWSWLLAAAALVLSVIVALSADGFGRVTWPGLAWLLGAGPGLALAWSLRELAPVEAWPASPALEGAVAVLLDTAWLALAQLAHAAAETVVWAHLVPAGIGAAFVLIGVSGALAAQLRPSRRGRF